MLVGPWEHRQAQAQHKSVSWVSLKTSLNSFSRLLHDSCDACSPLQVVCLLPMISVLQAYVLHRVLKHLSIANRQTLGITWNHYIIAAVLENENENHQMDSNGASSTSACSTKVHFREILPMTKIHELLANTAWSTLQAPAARNIAVEPRPLCAVVLSKHKVVFKPSMLHSSYHDRAGRYFWCNYKFLDHLTYQRHYNTRLIYARLALQLSNIEDAAHAAASKKGTKQLSAEVTAAAGK